MVELARLLLLLTLILSILLVAVSVSVHFWRGSASTRSAKRHTSPPETPSSQLQSELASLREDVGSLFSTLEKNSTTLKRLSSRAGMRETRERRESGSAPPVGAPKADLLRHYGMSGKVGPAFAQAQLELESRRPRGEQDELH